MHSMLSASSGASHETDRLQQTGTTMKAPSIAITAAALLAITAPVLAQDLAGS